MNDQTPRPLVAAALRVRALVVGGALGALGTSLGGGCATVSNARWAQCASNAVPGERTPTAAELGLPSSGPVALDVVVRTALRVHPSVVGARRAMEAAEARVRQAEAAYRPRVSMGASASYEDSKSQSAGTHRFQSYGFDVSWLLFDFGQSAALARQAGEQWLAAQEDLRAAEVAVAFNARSQYFNLERQLGLLEVAKETVRQLETHLEQTQERVKVGSRIAYDVTKAEVDLGNARVAEVVATDLVEAAHGLLGNAVGLAEVVHWAPTPNSPTPGVPETFDAAWLEARTHAPALAAAAAREEGANALVDARIAALYPSLSLEAGYQRAGTSLPLPWGLHAGPSVQWTPFDGFENLATIDEAVASLGQSRASHALLEQQAWVDVRAAWLEIEDAKQRLALTTVTVKSARQNLDFAQGLFDAGKATSVELADARQQLIVAHVAVITSRTDLATARARMAKAIGVAEGSKP